jgi:hypothetical protein
VCWIPHSNSHLEDTILYGDDQGYVNLLTIAAKDLTPRNSKGDSKLKEQENIAIDPQKLTQYVHDVTKSPEIEPFACCGCTEDMYMYYTYV